MKLKENLKPGFARVILIIGLTILSAFNPLEAKGSSFNRRNEPNEAAFSLLVPDNWQLQGGIFRVNALQAGGPINAVEAKCDLVLKSDQNETISFHIFPDIVYAHQGVGGGFFPEGSNYQGAEVRKMVDASTFLQILFPRIRNNVSSVKLLKITPLVGEKQALDKSLAYTNQLLAQLGLQALSFQSDAAGAIFEYVDGGKKFREIFLTGIINMPAALTWKNTRTISFRAPADVFDEWRSALDIIRFSIQFNPGWILKESDGQRQRAEIVQKVYEEVRKIDQEMIRKTTVNREEIMNDNFLVLTEQEEFVNPYSGEIEMDTSDYRYRWITSGGDHYYSNNENDNPNIILQSNDYKLSPVRKRRNE